MGDECRFFNELGRQGRDYHLLCHSGDTGLIGGLPALDRQGNEPIFAGRCRWQLKINLD